MGKFLCTLYPNSSNVNILYNPNTFIKTKKLTLIQCINKLQTFLEIDYCFANV